MHHKHTTIRPRSHENWNEDGNKNAISWFTDQIARSIPPFKPIVLVMGVCGSGKSAIGALLAEALQVPFLEGDAFHCTDNVGKMRTGIPLTDADRAEWLVALADTLSNAGDSGAVLTCSALKQRYRDVLRGGLPTVSLL